MNFRLGQKVRSTDGGKTYIVLGDDEGWVRVKDTLYGDAMTLRPSMLVSVKEDDAEILREFFAPIMRTPTSSELMGLGGLSKDGLVMEREEAMWVYEPGTMQLERMDDEGNCQIYHIVRVG